MENKGISAITIKAIDEEKRQIAGIASTPTVDRVNDIVEPLGLTFAQDAPLLLNHDKTHPVGTVKFGTPTARGLPFTATIPKVAEAGVVKDRTDEAWHSVKHGLIKSVSIGFIPKESKPMSNGGTRFTRAAVHELSLVAVPANPDAVITSFKSVAASPVIAAPAAIIPQSTKEVPGMKKQVLEANSSRAQILNAISKHWPADTVTKATVAPATTANNPTLVYPGQAAGVLVPPTTLSLIEALSKGGAANLPPNTRLLTQAVGLMAAEVAQGASVPAIAPDVEFTLTDTQRKFALILSYTAEMVAAGNVDNSVLAFVEQQLTDAANNATDAFLVGLIMATGVTVGFDPAQNFAWGDAMSTFTGDLRSSVWIAHPNTLAMLQDATNPNIGPAGGTLRNLPALATYAAPANKLFLIDRKRTAVYDGAMSIDRTEQASIVMDTAPGSAPANTSQPVSLFQRGLVALKVTKYADAKLLTAPLIMNFA